MLPPGASERCTPTPHCRGRLSDVFSRQRRQLSALRALASAGQSIEAGGCRQLCCRQVPACLGLSSDVPVALCGRCRQHRELAGDVSVLPLQQGQWDCAQPSNTAQQVQSAVALCPSISPSSSRASTKVFASSTAQLLADWTEDEVELLSYQQTKQGQIGSILRAWAACHTTMLVPMSYCSVGCK